MSYSRYLVLLKKVQLSPRFFKKVIGKLYSPLSVRPSRYLLINHWTKSNQIWSVSCSREWGAQRHIFYPAPWGPGEGAKGQVSLNFNYKVNYKYFKQSVVCLLTDERYNTYQMGFSFRHLGHTPGLGLGGTRRVWAPKFFSPKFNHILYVSYFHEWHVQWHICFGPRPLGGGDQRSDIIKL